MAEKDEILLAILPASISASALILVLLGFGMQRLESELQAARAKANVMMVAFIIGFSINLLIFFVLLLGSAVISLFWLVGWWTSDNSYWLGIVLFYGGVMSLLLIAFAFVLIPFAIHRFGR